MSESEDDNVLVTGITGDRGAIGFFHNLPCAVTCGLRQFFVHGQLLCHAAYDVEWVLCFVRETGRG